MDFGEAIKVLKLGGRVRRAGWNGKGAWLVLMPGYVIQEADVDARVKKLVPTGDFVTGAYIVMWTDRSVWQAGWLASQADMLSDDWQVVTDGGE